MHVNTPQPKLFLPLNFSNSTFALDITTITEFSYSYQTSENSKSNPENISLNFDINCCENSEKTKRTCNLSLLQEEELLEISMRNEKNTIILRGSVRVSLLTPWGELAFVKPTMNPNNMEFITTQSVKCIPILDYTQCKRHECYVIISHRKLREKIVTLTLFCSSV